MKNPLAYLKHIVKDPINTVAEADERKKEIMPLLYGSAGVLALGVILQVAAKLDFMAVFSFIGLVGVGFCGFLFTVISSAKKRFEALTCSKCNSMSEIKTSAEFAKYVSFAVEKDEAVYIRSLDEKRLYTINIDDHSFGLNELLLWFVFCESEAAKKSTYVNMEKEYVIKTGKKRFILLICLCLLTKYLK